METAIQILALVTLAAHIISIGCASLSISCLAYRTLLVTSLLLSIFTLTYIHGL